MGKKTQHVVTFKAGEALLQYRRVKIESGTTSTPPEVVYADAGEQAIGEVMRDTADGALVAVRIFAWETKEGRAADSFSIGASLYSAADGSISDTSSGSAIGIALEAATAAGDIVEYLPFGVLSTTAATVSILDSGGFTSAATVEAALAEIYQDLLSAQNFLSIPLNSWREASSFDVGAIAANGGVLASDTTPILEAINGATDGCQRINWAATNVDQVVTSIPLPPDLDVTADLVLHTRIASASTTDAVGFTVDTFFNEGDTKVTDTSETNQTATFAEKITTIAAADIPAGAQTLTIGLTPVAHGTDAMYLTATWLEYKRAILTS
jgi:hypothetical protein